MKLKLTLVSLFFLPMVWSQGFVFNRLSSIQQNQPEKLEQAAERYAKLFPKDPASYYFLAEIAYEKFIASTEDKERSKHLYACLKQAYKVQGLDEKEEITETSAWFGLREKIKYEGFFFTKESSDQTKIEQIRKKYYLFMSKGESDYMLESALGLEVPASERVDTLFYGMPTGNENVKREFAEEELKMLALINEERQKMGLSVMELDTSLSRACRYQAYDMGTQNYFSHIGQDLGADGREYFANYTFDRIRQFYSSSRVLGENLSYGRNNAHFTYKGWFDSKGHNEIMFNPENNRVGIGFVHVPGNEKKYFWALCTAN